MGIRDISYFVRSTGIGSTDSRRVQKQFTEVVHDGKNNLYAMSNNDAVYKSENLGLTWNILPTPKVPRGGICCDSSGSIAVAMFDNTIAYSENSGKNWRVSSSSIATTVASTSVAISSLAFYSSSTDGKFIVGGTNTLGSNNNPTCYYFTASISFLSSTIVESFQESGLLQGGITDIKLRQNPSERLFVVLSWVGASFHIANLKTKDSILLPLTNSFYSSSVDNGAPNGFTNLASVALDSDGLNSYTYLTFPESSQSKFFSSSTGNSGTFLRPIQWQSTNGEISASVYSAYSSKNNMLYYYSRRGLLSSSLDIYNQSGSFIKNDGRSNFFNKYYGGAILANGVLIDYGSFIGGTAGVNGTDGFIERTVLTSNSESFANSTFATSINYVTTSSYFSGSLVNAYILNNVSEYPFHSPYSQMKSVRLGSVDSGKVGYTDDCIIQVKRLGSFVQIMWPKQDSNFSLKGFSETSKIIKVGELNTTFTSGDYVDVGDYDSMTLFCYIKKYASGTLDDVVVQVERKPLKDINFTIEQGVEVSTSGSYVEARHRDLYNVKQIDYGDLTISEIGWPIDIDLVNTKRLRISAKHKNGQALQSNKNLIVYGRFIKSSKDHNET